MTATSAKRKIAEFDAAAREFPQLPSDGEFSYRRRLDDHYGRTAIGAGIVQSERRVAEAQDCLPAQSRRVYRTIP